MNDLHNSCRQVVAVAPAAMTTTAGITGRIIDRQGYGGVEFFPMFGAVTATDATITIRIKEGDVTGTLTSVADTDLRGTEALAGLGQAVRTDYTGDKVARRIGYKGNKRYIQASIAASTVTAGAIVGILGLLHSPGLAPTANP